MPMVVRLTVLLVTVTYGKASFATLENELIIFNENEGYRFNYDKLHQLDHFIQTRFCGILRYSGEFSGGQPLNSVKFRGVKNRSTNSVELLD